MQADTCPPTHHQWLWNTVIIWPCLNVSKWVFLCENWKPVKTKCVSLNQTRMSLFFGVSHPCFVPCVFEIQTETNVTPALLSDRRLMVTRLTIAINSCFFLPPLILVITAQYINYRINYNCGDIYLCIADRQRRSSRPTEVEWGRGNMAK